MKRFIIALVSTLVLKTDAFTIKSDCIKKINVLVGTVSDTATDFDWTKEIRREFNTQSVPVLKRSCISPIGDLNSFRIVMRGYDLSSNVLSNSAGPSESGTCNNVKAPV